MTKKDYYQVLNVLPKANLKEIKSAYRLLALKYHPDHNPNNPEAVKMFAEIREAYEFLTNTDLREKYDRQYKPMHQSHNSNNIQEFDTGPQGGKTGKNLRYNLYVTLETVVTGCEKTLRYIRKNLGTNETIQLKVKVPIGAFHHQRLKLSHYGDVDKEGTGDLFVIIHLQEHPVFLRSDLNVRVNVPVTYLDVMLGSTIEVPTLSGVHKIKLKSCEFEKLDFRMKGFGLPDPKNQSRGDLLIYCFIEHPKKISQTERNGAQKLLNSWPHGEMMQQYQIYLKQIKGS